MLTYQAIKHNTKEEILSYGLIGIEFEFYSNMTPEKTVDSFKTLLNKKIRLEEEAHSDFKPTEKEFKIEKDFSGGAGMMELVTGAVSYEEGRNIIIKVLKWIEENGYTNEKCSIHLNLSFDPEKTEKPGLISKMDPLKFVLDFNEKEVYKLFPNREETVYAKSIKWVMPKIEANYFNGQYINSHVFDFGKEKYYGVNFEKLQLGYLEFRYIGGKDYEKKISNILYLLDRFFIQLWSSANSGKYTDLNLVELKKILAKNNPYIEILKDWRNIEKHFKDVKIYVDLMATPQVMDIHWPRIKNQVIKILSHGGMRKGQINYDSDLSRVQVKDAKLTHCFGLSYLDFVDCEISGTLEACDFFRCILKNVNAVRCNLYQGTSVSESKLESCYTNQSVEVTNSFVFKWDTVFKGKMIGGIFRHGKISKEATFDKTEVIQSKKIN